VVATDEFALNRYVVVCRPSYEQSRPLKLYFLEPLPL